MDKRKDDTARRSVLHIWEEDGKSHILCVKDDEMDSDRMALSATALRKLLSNPSAPRWIRRAMCAAVLDYISGGKIPIPAVFSMVEAAENGDTPEVEVFDIPLTSGGDTATLS